MTTHPMCKCGHRKSWHKYKNGNECTFIECSCNHYEPDTLIPPPFPELISIGEEK